MPRKKKNNTAEEAEAKAKAEAEEKAKAKEKAKAEEKARIEADARKKAEAEKKAREEKEAADRKAAEEARNALVEMIAVEPILHDGENVFPGEWFEATQKQAARHLRKGTAEEA